MPPLPQPAIPRAELEGVAHPKADGGNEEEGMKDRIKDKRDHLMNGGTKWVSPNFDSPTPVLPLRPPRKPKEEPMPYVAFETCTVPVGGQPKRGAKATCGFCQRTESLHINTMRSHGGDEEQVEKAVARKFENLGWKVGRTATQHRCPACFAALKSASAKKRENHDMDNKVVSINPPPPTPDPVMVAVEAAPRRPSRDERRIIHNKIDENYVSEAVGYAAGWNDKRVASDLGVPQAWVAEIRDENFGPNVDEALVAAMADGKAMLEEIQAARMTAEPMLKALNELIARSARIEQALQSFGEGK
jgi:hypothetical protein